jgi:hypothetical protein
LKESPIDSYAALDFFVTAYQMLNWLHPGGSNKAKRKQMERDSNLLQIISHLANGSKHFQATHPQHVSVKDTNVKISGFDPNSFDSKVFDVGELRVELDGEAAREFGASIGVLELADQTVHFWEEHVHPRIAFRKGIR